MTVVFIYGIKLEQGWFCQGICIYSFSFFLHVVRSPGGKQIGFIHEKGGPSVCSWGMGPKPGDGVFWDFSCKFTSGLRAGHVPYRSWCILVTLAHTEGKGELRCTAPQSGPGLLLALPGELQHRPEPESRLFNLPTLRRSFVTHVGSARAATSCWQAAQQSGVNYFIPRNALIIV